MKSAIILAAGKGTRMRSQKPKTLHPLLGKPMILYIVDHVKAAGADSVVTVIGYGASEMTEVLKGHSDLALQSPQLGTGHALMCCESLKTAVGPVLVANGDCPLIQPETYRLLYESLEDNAMVVLSAVLPDGGAYGRIIRDAHGQFKKITEYKDCSEAEKKIREINTGIYVFNGELLAKNLQNLKNDNAQKEYYITDLVDIFFRQGLKVKAVVIDDYNEAAGINDRFELAMASHWLQKRINAGWMKNGVTIVDWETTRIGPDVVIGEDTFIHPGSSILGATKIGVGNTIFPGCWLENAVIGDHNEILSSRITDSQIKDNIHLGPYAHLRNHCVIESDCRIGNFVEMKNTKLGKGTKCAHLTYLGDSEVGERVNFGCGVVTVNYDGKNKFKTVIGDDSFIGSNVNLIAPVTIGKRAVLAAGSTVNSDVGDGEMAIARNRQTNKPGYGEKYLKK